MHRIKWMCILLFFGSCTTILGSTKMMCTSVNPKLNSTVVCKCEESDGSDITWLKDDNIFSACSASSGYCIPEPPQYVLNYTKTGTVAYYNLTISSYDYTYCGKYTCSDFSSPPVSADVSISIHAFDSRLPTQIEEPLSNHSNGNIYFITGCIFQTMEVAKNVKWYKLVNDDEFELDTSELNFSNDSSSCNQCIGEQASKLIITYDHKEATGAGVEEGRLRITLFHNQNKSEQLNMTTTYYYYIKGDQDSTTNTNSFTNHTIVGTTSAAVSFSREVGSNATTEIVIFNTTANSTVYPSNEKFKTTYIFVFTIVGVLVLGAVVVVLFLCLITSSPSSTPNNVSDGFNNTCGCNNTCDCDIKELIIVIAVAWGGAITLTFVGSCILKYSLNIADLHECIFKLGSLPWIFLLVVVLLYKRDKKRGLIPLVISFVLDAVFIGIDIYYVCLSENGCAIELLDHLWASFIYLMVCAVLSVLKYIILEKCCDSDSSVSNSNLDLKQSDVEDKHEQRGARPLPPMTNVSSRLGNEKEHAHSLTHVQLTHRSPLPPISPKKNS